MVYPPAVVDELSFLAEKVQVIQTETNQSPAYLRASRLVKKNGVADTIIGVLQELSKDEKKWAEPPFLDPASSPVPCATPWFWRKTVINVATVRHANANPGKQPEQETFGRYMRGGDPVFGRTVLHFLGWTVEACKGRVRLRRLAVHFRFYLLSECSREEALALAGVMRLQRLEKNLDLVERYEFAKDADKPELHVLTDREVEDLLTKIAAECNLKCNNERSDDAD
jgi:hypothetical protein